MPTTSHNLEKGEKCVDGEAIEHMWAAMNQCTDITAITVSYDICCRFAYNQALLENQAAMDAAGDAGNVEGAGGGSES